MTMSTFIAIGFTIGWLPITVSSLIYDWTAYNTEFTEKIVRDSYLLCILQSFSNAIIFRVQNKNILEYLRSKVCGGHTENP